MVSTLVGYSIQIREEKKNHYLLHLVSEDMCRRNTLIIALLMHFFVLITIYLLLFINLRPCTAQSANVTDKKLNQCANGFFEGNERECGRRAGIH